MVAYTQTVVPQQIRFCPILYMVVYTSNVIRIYSAIQPQSTPYMIASVYACIIILYHTYYVYACIIVLCRTYYVYARIYNYNHVSTSLPLLLPVTASYMMYIHVLSSYVYNSDIYCFSVISI